MQDTPNSSEPPLLPEPKTAVRYGCLVKIGFVLLGLFVAGSLGLYLFSRPFVDRTRRANAFGQYIKTGFTIEKVFSGPQEWDNCWVSCIESDKVETMISIYRREGRFEVGRGITNIIKDYPDIDALLLDLVPGKGAFAGRYAINFTYKFYVVSRTYVLTIGKDGQVEKIDIISRS